MSNKLSEDELQIRLEVRKGHEVKRQTWREYSKSFIPFPKLFDALVGEIEKTLPFLRRRL